MIEEGYEGIEIQQGENETTIIQTWPDGSQTRTEIPHLNNRNSVALDVWDLQQSIPYLGLFETLKILGLELEQIELHILAWKLVEIQRIINKFQMDKIKK